MIWPGSTTAMTSALPSRPDSESSPRRDQGEVKAGAYKSTAANEGQMCPQSAQSFRYPDAAQEQVSAVLRSGNVAVGGLCRCQCYSGIWLAQTDCDGQGHWSLTWPHRDHWRMGMFPRHSATSINPRVVWISQAIWRQSRVCINTATTLQTSALCYGISGGCHDTKVREMAGIPGLLNLGPSPRLRSLTVQPLG